MNKWILIFLCFTACKSVDVPKTVTYKTKTGFRVVPIYTLEQLSVRSDSMAAAIGVIIEHYVALDKNFYVDSQQVMRFKSFVSFDSVWAKYMNVGPSSPINNTNPHDGNDTLKTDGLQHDSLPIKVQQ